MVQPSGVAVLTGGLDTTLGSLAGGGGAPGSVTAAGTTAGSAGAAGPGAGGAGSAADGAAVTTAHTAASTAAPHLVPGTTATSTTPPRGNLQVGVGGRFSVPLLDAGSQFHQPQLGCAGQQGVPRQHPGRVPHRTGQRQRGGG